jgi:hypothetical protein
MELDQLNYFAKVKALQLLDFSQGEIGRALGMTRGEVCKVLREIENLNNEDYGNVLHACTDAEEEFGLFTVIDEEQDMRLLRRRLLGG